MGEALLDARLYGMIVVGAILRVARRKTRPEEGVGKQKQRERQRVRTINLRQLGTHVAAENRLDRDHAIDCVSKLLYFSGGNDVLPSGKAATAIPISRQMRALAADVRGADYYIARQFVLDLEIPVPHFGILRWSQERKGTCA